MKVITFKFSCSLKQVIEERGTEDMKKIMKSSVTIIVNDKTNLKVHFSYVNWNDSQFRPSDQIEYFEYKYLRRELVDEKDKEQMMKMKRYEEGFNSNIQ
ncbi:antitoxin YezG family protein [Priestia megaterium]|uniref:antitoxin YezG family protein n=4 Tax=Priestia megaterium TaxID=1404 RepID=UPI00211D2DAE|nr:antitoxin YezG family protein [Priestia megaterium]